MTTPTPNGLWHTAFDVYRHVLERLPMDCAERYNLASVAAWRVQYGSNITRIAEEMQRDRRWVYKRCEMLREQFPPTRQMDGWEPEEDWEDSLYVQK